MSTDSHASPGPPVGEGTTARPGPEGATAAGAAESGRVHLQLSVYPLRQNHLRPAIEAALRAAAGEGVNVTPGRLSTLISGDEPAVFAALRAAFRAAGSSGSTVMVATLTTGAPADETLADLQRAVGTAAG